jgi:hypothetical protein
MPLNVEEMVKGQGRAGLKEPAEKLETGTVGGGCAVVGGGHDDVDIYDAIAIVPAKHCLARRYGGRGLGGRAPSKDEFDRREECQKGANAVQHRFAVEDEQVEFEAA